jgi:hypothetical protein
MLANARARAKKYDREFSITESDIIIPEVCPILGIEMIPCSDGPGSPTLDRIDNDQGYVAGNVHVISKSANAKKRKKTVAQLAAGLAGPEWKAWARKRLGRPVRRAVTGRRAS